MSNFSRVSRETLYDAGFIKLVSDTVHEETTGEDFTRVCLAHIGAVMIIPVFENGDIMLVNQYRASIDSYSLEVVAGRKDIENEDYETCALRELKEEIGVSATQTAFLGEWISSPGFTDEKLHGYLALNCEEPEENEPHGIEEKFATPLRVSFAEAFDIIEQGKIVDAKSILMIYRAALHQGITIPFLG